MPFNFTPRKQIGFKIMLLAPAFCGLLIIYLEFFVTNPEFTQELKLILIAIPLFLFFGGMSIMMKPTTDKENIIEGKKGD